MRFRKIADTSTSRLLGAKRSLSWCLLAGTLASLVCMGSSPQVLAATGSSKTYRLFSGRAKLTLPKGASAPKKLEASMYLVQPKDSSKKFALYVTRERLRADELKMSKQELGDSIKKLLEAQGYNVISFTSRGQDYRADFTTYSTLPWQPVGTTPARGVAKFTRTVDKQLIGTILMCEPSQWTDAAIGRYKRAVSSTKVSQR